MLDLGSVPCGSLVNIGRLLVVAVGLVELAGNGQDLIVAEYLSWQEKFAHKRRVRQNDDYPKQD